MVSIDALYPQTENDNTKEITTNSEELVSNLVCAVKEIVDAQTETSNRLVEKMTEVIKNADGNGDGDENGNGDENEDNEKGDENK